MRVQRTTAQQPCEKEIKAIAKIVEALSPHWNTDLRIRLLTAAAIVLDDRPLTNILKPHLKG